MRFFLFFVCFNLTFSFISKAAIPLQQKNKSINFDFDTTTKQTKFKNFIRIINPFDLRGKSKNPNKTTTGKTPKPKNYLLGTLSLLLGLAAFVSIIFYFPVALILAIGAIILGILGINNKEDPRALSVIGIAAGGLILLMTIIALIAFLS